ncbi:hypothetical protein ACHAWO_013731 [Cyclotella atomus]|uniref:C2H2-type domain-containing protein n=1 Tax=Cyclotella atomus TaxID=382360 RepID=A0ABD3QU35_9STRA
MLSDVANDGNGPMSRPDGDLVENNRSIIATATKDSLDQPAEQIADTKELLDESSMSIASTVDVDNTSCYLKRCAYKFAHEKRKHEAGVHTMFVKINKYKMGQEVIYTGHGSSDRAIIVDVHYEDNNLPRYNIELIDGYVEAHVGEDQLARLDKTKDGNHFKVSRAPRIPTLCDSQSKVASKVVDFDSKSTSLFSHLYCGDYKEARSSLVSHPDEACVWVIRYRKPDGEDPNSRTGAQLHKSIRWKLLPLHIFIILSGSHDYTDGREEGAAPPLELLKALIEAYPRATKCIDDQHMIPLHASIRGHSSPCIIQALVDASPDSVLWKDAKGRDAFALLEQVFKRLMSQAVINAEAESETDDALEIRKWKQEVLHVLTNATKCDQDNTQAADSLDLEFDVKHVAEDEAPTSICKELDDGNAKYLQLCFSSNNESASTQDITPCSTMTPTSTDKEGRLTNNEDVMNWEARCRMLELESYDSEDRNIPLTSDCLGANTAVTILDDTTNSSFIFRNRESHHEESVRRSNLVAGSSDSNIAHFASENARGEPIAAHDTTFDSSMMLASIFSYEDEGDSA